MNSDQAKTLSETALTRLMEALEQDHSQALKQYLSSFGYKQPSPFSLPTTHQSRSQSIKLHEVNRR